MHVTHLEGWGAQFANMCVEVFLQVFLAPLEDQGQLLFTQLNVEELHDVVVVDCPEQTDFAKGALQIQRVRLASRLSRT